MKTVSYKQVIDFLLELKANERLGLNNHFLKSYESQHSFGAWSDNTWVCSLKSGSSGWLLCEEKESNLYCPLSA